MLRVLVHLSVAIGILSLPAAARAEPLAQARGGNGVSITMRYADGQPIKNTYISLYATKADANGTLIRAARITYASSGETGVARLPDVLDGTYLLGMDFESGYDWDRLDQPIQLSGRAQIGLDFQAGRLALTLRNGDSSLVKNRYVNVYTVKKDADGHDLKDKRFTYKSTADTGKVLFDLVPGRYMFDFETIGYPWSDLSRPVDVSAGKALNLEQAFGHVAVIPRDSSGALIKNTYIYLFDQTVDANGSPIAKDRVAYASTGDTGKVDFDVTPGMYAIRYDLPSRQNITLTNIAAVSGQVTTFDGNNPAAPPPQNPAPAPEPAPIAEAPQPAPEAAPEAASVEPPAPACVQPTVLGCVLRIGEPVQAAFAALGDAHFWRVRVTNGATYQVSLTGLQADLDLHVFANGEPVSESTTEGLVDEVATMATDGPTELAIYINSPLGEVSDAPYTLQVMQLD